MTDYINILKQQVEEGRRSGLSNSGEISSTRQSIQKKKLIPLENPESDQNESKNEKNAKTNRISTPNKLQQSNKPIYKEVSTEPDKVDNLSNRPKLSTMSTDPINPEPIENDQINEPQKQQTGGALWDAPKEFQDIRSSMKSLPQQQQQQQQPEKKPCLFDLVMQPPKKELKPTLFTYFDKLMQMGEV